MLDLLSPLRGYIAQNLQFYLSKYIKDIQLEGLGLFGGDLVLNDLEIKRHVLRESLEIPPSFDFSRGFIRELRIHIPWTQLLSQPIEVKLYTIELILTAKSDAEQRSARASSHDTAHKTGETPEDKIEQPKSGWIHDTLQKILANISVQVNNLVLKYEHDDVVFSIALGTLDFYSASENEGWKRSFEELKGGRRAICKRIDAKDVTIFLDRYTSDGDTKDGMTQDPVRRKVIGYEVPVLSRTSASVRAKLQLFTNATVNAQNGRGNKANSPQSPLHRQSVAANDDCDGGNIIDVDGLFAYRPSVLCDPFYYYSCNRSRVMPMYEVDIFIGELLFSVSDRQLEMLNQLIKSASRKIDQAHAVSSQRRNRDLHAKPDRVSNIPVVVPQKEQTERQKMGSSATKQESWFGWAMNALGTVEDEDEDELVSELLAETRGALLKGQPPVSNTDDNLFMSDGPVTKTSCVRVCIRSASLTLRKHDKEEQVENEESTIAESKEEFVPVANLGMVKVSLQTRKRKVARPPVPILHLTLSYVALELLLARGEEKSGTDLVFEIEMVELVSDTTSNSREDSKYNKGNVLLSWGSIDSSHFSACVSHPYFINSFFGEETTRLNQRDSRSFEIVKVSLDADIPVWKTLEINSGRNNSNENSNSVCACFTTWNGKSVRCIPIATISGICQQTIRAIGIKERVLDGGILSNAVSTAWASSGFPISISEVMSRAIASAAEEYRANRNPDLGAPENLAQLLQPQLTALFSRYTLHSCSAALLKPSSFSSSTIRHRSVHSALRMRLSSTSTFTNFGESEVPVKKETVSKVLDISLGAVRAVLEPPICLEVIEALSIIAGKNEDDANKSVVERSELSASATQEMEPSNQSVMQSDTTLATANSVHIRLPNLHENSGQNAVGTRFSGCLGVVVNDFAWLGTFHPGNNKSRLQISVLTAHLERSQTECTLLPLVEALGVELLATGNSADASDNDEIFANFNKLKIDLSLYAAQNVAALVNGLSSPIGYPIAWEPMNLAAKTLQTSFEIEVCGATFSRIVSNKPRLVMAHYQTLKAEVGSASISLASATSKTKGSGPILQGGAAPMTTQEMEVNTPLFKTEISQEKSSGILNAVPLLGSLNLFSLNPGLLSTTSTHCQLSVEAQLARVYIELQGLSHLSDAVLRLVSGITANLVVKKELTPALGGLDNGDQRMNPTSSAPTGWVFTFDLKAAGGEVHVNEALELKLPLLSISSMEADTGPAHQAIPGGELKLVFAMKGASITISESGVLKGLGDPMILDLQDVEASGNFLHRFLGNYHAYSVDASIHVSGIQVSLSRLKLLYLTKNPFLKSKAQQKSFQASQPGLAEKDKVGSGTELRSRWYWRLGAQVDHVGFSCTADINHLSRHQTRQIRAVVDGKVANVGVAIRNGNHHPTKNHLQPTGCGGFTDIQVSVGNIQVVERLQNARRDIRTGFGEFSRLPEHAFLGILVCVDMPDLKSLSDAFFVLNTNISDQQTLPSAMLSWHLTSSIAKAFQEASTKWHRREAEKKQPTAEIPLVVTWNDSAKTTHSFPLFSGFYRNYNEAGLPHHVIAGSMESVDVAVTTSSLYCLASVLQVRGRESQKPFSRLSDTTKAIKTDDPTNAEPSLDGTSSRSLSGVEISLLLGQVRLILPNESLMDSILSRQSIVDGNVVIVLESLSIASTMRNNISLDGLGYPPFNSRVLPRRPNIHAQRFGQSQLRIGCRAGNISGFVAGLEFNKVAPASSMFEATGPFEEYVGCVAGYSARFFNAETFWSPLNVACTVEEEPHVSNDGKPGVKTTASIVLTKVRLDLHKPSFDVLVTRVAGMALGIGVLRRSVAKPARVKMIPVQLSKPQKPTSFLDGANQREISISCDGIEVNAFEMNRSTHIRVGSIVLAHNFSVLSGSVSVQNLVVGHRPNEKPNSLTQETTVIEEVIFGANVEPSLWQMAVENYPEKLIAGRWNFSDRAEGTLFLDVQAYQLHVSHHFLLASAQFTHTKSEFSFSELHQELRMNEIVDPPMECKPFVFQQRWNIKVLVAPSVVSYWRQNPTKRGRSGVWITSGQLFVSVGVGSDEMAQQALCTYGYVVNEINRFVAVPTLEMMLNLDKFGINTSDDLPSLEVQFQRNSVGLVQSHTSSTWQQFSKYISVVSEAQRVVYDCSIRITGEQHQMLERAKVGETGVCILCTDLARTSIQAEVNALCVKLSPFSLGAMKSLLAVRVEGNKQFSGEDSPTSDIVIQRRTGYENFGLSTDDFKNLRRMAEGRRPSPGELVLTEALLIETQSVISSSSSPVVGAKVHIHIDPNKFNINLADVTAYLGDCNESWGVEAHGTNGERTSYTNLGNKTHSWMGMRWCYHIPRKICKIVANPVPVPPTGIPSGWPSWSWNQHEESDAGRVCDIFCQLRCWDSKKACFVVICEFYVPWERPSTNSGSDGMEDTDEPGSFGELMSQWFDDDMEKTRYRAKLLEFAAQRRTIFFDNEQPSDNWELRWRSPLQSEQESENKQKRLVVNALLASSLQVHSFVACSAYQRVVSSVILPQATLSISHVGSENDSHDMITAEINDTVLSCAICGDTRARTLNVRASSALQVYLDNMVQLLTVSVIPRTTIDAMVDASEKGLEVSTLIGPTSVYLNQTSILVVSAIPKLLQADPEEFQVITTTSDEKLSSMRITIINYSGMDIWYGQEGTSECLLLAADASAAYSWLSLANNPFYQLRFAVDDPHHKPTEGLTSDKMQTDSDESVQEDPCWSDPCRIKDNSVTARYFGGHGFLWVCVELRGLQTVVTLRSSLTVRNYCDFPVRIQVNKQDFEHSCARSDSLYKDTPIMQKISHHHPNCISLDGSACAVTTYAKVEHNVSRVMVESVSTIDFGIHGGPWCSAPTQGHVPKEFDLVKISDNEADGSKKAKCNFATLRPQHSSEVTHYVWSKVARSQCRTVLPTDFDPLQPHVSRRYTWMEMTLWPAVTVENIMDIPLTLSLSQKATAVNLKISPSSEQSLSVINPFEPMSIQLHYDQCSSSEQSSLKSQEFLLECTTPEDSKQQIFVFEGCRVVAGFCHDHRPMIRIRTERILSVANMTSSALNIKIGTPLGNKRALERIDSCVERSVCFSMISNRLVISIATFKDSNHETDQFEWSPEISMNVKGETKPIIVPSGRPELRSLLSAYCVDLINSDGYLRLIIRPQVVVVNSTNCDLKCVATDGRGNALVGDDEASLISGNNGGWSVPVCLHKEAKKRSITADVSSWLSSRLSRRPSEDLTNAPKQPLVAKLSCSFRVTLEEDGYEWTEEIAVLLPKIPLQFNPDGKLTSVEPPTSSSTPTTTQDGLYPAPSTTTHRRRLLIRHRDFKHKMLTYTMTQKGKSIHIMFFVDHQAPVVIHNQWQNMLGFRNVSFPSDPEGVGANFYLEYDWGLQVSAKQHRSIPEEGFGIDDTEHDSERKLLSDWLAASSQSLENVDIAATTTNERMRFQIGSPEYGWSNTLWQVGGIQFASFASATDKPSPTFLVMCYFRAGSWLLSITCLEDPTREGQLNLKPSLVLPSMASPVKTKQTAPSFLRVGVVVEELSFHFCDEHDPVRDARGMILYPEILRATCSAVSIVFATAPDPPEVSRHSTHLGYLSHIRSYTTLFVTMEDIEVGHFLQTCNFPVILCFPETHTSKDLLNFDRVKKHARLGILMGKLLDKQLPGAENASLITRVIYTDTWDPTGIPSYFHSIELKLAPAVLQVEDDILLYMNAYMRPIVDALEGEAAGRVPLVSSEDHCLTSSWSLHAYESVTVTKQRKVYIEHLGISNLQVTITARVSIPVLNSFDGTPLHFGATEMCEVFSFPDQLYKDLAADYVADTIVRSPMLLMSLNIIGNPAGFLRSFGQGVRDLVEIPLAASRNGYSPWVLTKGVVGGVASFFGHATAATLTSVSGFSYSFSRTMDQLTLPSDELRKRHYTRPTQLSSALADGLGSLGSSVVGAAAGVITTPIAVYKERQMQGLETGLRNVVGGVGMGLVGIVARPMGGVASLVSMASDGLLYGLGGSRTPFDDSVSRFDARPNELLRYKLKVLPDAIGSSLIFAHGVWVVPDENKLLVFEQDLDYISKEQLEASENEPIRSLLLPGDTTHRLIQVTVVCSNECVYVVGVSGAQNQAVLARTPLESIEAIEESLKEATVFDLGIKTLASAEWLRFRLSPGQRRHLSHQLRLRLAEESSCLVVHPLALENLEKGERLRRIDAVLNLRSRVKKMEVNERAKAEGVESKSSDGVNIFRLMKLMRETQCEMEVVKPVLDELEVMRLCRSFGMMSSVNPKDFNFDVLHAREFDDDFIRFLRFELFERSCPGDVAVKGLFGRQDQVADALVGMRACSTETVATLAASDEGMYCVKLNTECREVQDNEDEKSGSLVVFSWIRDELFEPQGLRDTPAFVLRFLTGLTSDIVCCTSALDLELIKTATTASDEQEDDELSSYSVSFHIEKQEDQSDSTKCVAVSSVDLDTLPENYSNICLLKGAYPAIAVTGAVNSAIRIESRRRTFQTGMQVSFAAWLKAESERYRIDLSPTIVRSPKLCKNILKEFDMWPEEQMKASRDAYEKKQQEEFKKAVILLENEIVNQREKIDRVSDELFRLHSTRTPEVESDSSFQEAMTIYEEFQEWLTSVCSWKLDRKFRLVMDSPTRLREIVAGLYGLYSRGHKEVLSKLLGMCVSTSKTELLQAMNKCRGRTDKKQSSGTDKAEHDNTQVTMWEKFLDEIAEPLEALRTKWWIAVQSGLAVAKDVSLESLKSEQKHAKTVWYDNEKLIIESNFDQLRKRLTSKDGLTLSVSAQTRGRGIVHCDASREVLAPPTRYLDIMKLDVQGGKEYLGRLLLEPNKSHVAMFTVKVRSAVQICTGTERMCAKFIHFPTVTDPSRPPRASAKVIRTFGQFASVCDYDARNRIMTFLSKDSVGIYKFDESFKNMELMKRVDLGVRSTLTELPFTDVLLVGSIIYVTDSSGDSQAIDIHNDQTSNVVSVPDGAEVDVTSSRLLELADNLAIGVVSFVPSDDGAFDGALESISCDDYRHLPVLPLGMKFLTDRVSVQCFDDRVLVLDPLVQKVYMLSIQVTVRSDSYRMRQSDNGEAKSCEASNADCPRKQHWIYTFYHVFEKFPVRGFLDSGSPPLTSVLIACPGVGNISAALEIYHDFLSLLMSDLMALNKPLHGLDLTKGLAVQCSLYGVGMKLKPSKSFFQTLITFLPIQICRAEGNALTVLDDGMDQSLGDQGDELQTWGAADIAESIRFGLLSPLLCSWRGRCVVITSMGKQSTGKSYFLNHLTGASFAIAGNRCTDGAWMTLRIMGDVLLVVLDFEGLGSFERTDQEDVFLSVLNASLSMFTIFRMEMRFDKDIDGLFTKFQKGINLLKNDERLFQGTLYMSVKDVNPNDRHGVLSEFQSKFQKLLTANRENNFLTEMYSGKLGINCSPPLGTHGYYDSVRHARQLIEKLVNEPDSSRGFKNGSAFHDCIRLVLAKISILDWTAVDESSQRLEMNELYRKLPGAIRTGCLIPVDTQSRAENLPRSLKDPLLHNESVLCMLKLEQLCLDYPELSESWTSVAQEVSLDAMDDEDIDFGPSVCFHANASTGPVHSTLLNLFQRYLALTAKGPLEKIMDQDYASFDAMLSFIVCRRKTKVALWVKQFLGTERFLDEWEQIEQTYILPFEALFKRCLHACTQCQLQCMRSVCHSFDEDHDCGMSHTCRGLCEYCMLKYQPGKEMPQCVGKAGHEGKCDCAKGDHTCGVECSLVNASNCGGICVLIGGHDGDHRCSVKQHACGAACSAATCCGKCILNMEHAHTVHKCAEMQCKHSCEMDSCKERCSAGNHFHGQPTLGKKFAEENGRSPEYDSAQVAQTADIFHLCNSRHACNATCEAEGICTKSVQVSTSKFSGSCDTFDFELKQMIGVRNKCTIVLQSGKTNHDGAAHSCVKLLPNGTKTVHGCGVRCAACEYYCDKPVGHEGDHSAAHGNMRNMHFVAEDSVIHWENHKYAVGEKGVAEMCNMHCSSAGRGHVHYLKCDKATASTCVYTGLQDQRRHCTSELKPRPGHEVDELLHDKYWKTIGWEDPCRSAVERALFAKCPYKCDAPEHNGKCKLPSNCDLDVWHAPVTTPPVTERKGFSYVSGHRFACSHTSSTGNVHHVFVLDCSGSMRGEPWRELLRGVREYLRSRLVNGATGDIVSVVTFGNRGIIEYERVGINIAPSQRIDFRGGGTFYTNGLSQAIAIFSRTNLSAYKPVMIFFTDGRPADRKKGPAMAVKVRERYAKFGLRTFVVGYGRASDIGLADLAEKLGGSVHEALTTADLGEAFRSISMSLGARAGLIHSTATA